MGKVYFHQAVYAELNIGYSCRVFSKNRSPDARTDYIKPV